MRTRPAENGNIDRRSLLKGGVAGILGFALLPGHSRTLHAGLKVALDDPKAAAPLYRISLAQWSLHRALFAGELTTLDFPRAAKRTYGIEAVELVNTFFRDEVRNKAYLDDLKSRARDEGSKILLIMCDGLGALGDADPGKRGEAVENHRPWLEAAKHLGCHSIRVNAHSSGSREEQAARAAEGLRALVEHGAAMDLNVLVENHGGLSSDGAWLADVMRRVDHPRAGTLPDFGNFRIDRETVYDRYRGVKELMPYAKAVSAKSHDFDDEGNEIHTDFFRMMRIVVDAGYRGWVGVEYEGSGLSEPEGIHATKRLLERVREHLTRSMEAGEPARSRG